MQLFTMEYLIKCFTRAKEREVNYVAVVISMEGFPSNEVIINDSENIDIKLAYYQKTYDTALNHKFAKGIKIVGFASGNSFDDIEMDLNGW